MKVSAYKADGTEIVLDVTRLALHLEDGLGNLELTFTEKHEVDLFADQGLITLGPGNGNCSRVSVGSLDD